VGTEKLKCAVHIVFIHSHVFMLNKVSQVSTFEEATKEDYHADNVNYSA